MSRPLQVCLGTAVVLVLLAGPLLFARHQLKEMRNFRVVTDGVLYRSGQMSLDGLKRAVHDYGIRTVVNLRDGTTRADREEEAYCRRQEIRFVRIPPRPWEGPDDTAPVDKGVRTFLEVMADPGNYPVLVHCFAGVHRTGAYCALYRMKFQGWPNAQALEELKAGGYENLEQEKDILGYLQHYRPVAGRDE
jgi:tyrosine-protein phosphatase SIW14